MSQAARQSFPQINYDGYTTFGSGGGGRASQFTVSDTWSWAEVLSKTAGKHSLKFGGELRVLMNDQQNPTSSFGVFNFTRGFTQRNALAADAASGNAVASLLLGYPTDTSAICRSIRG